MTLGHCHPRTLPRHQWDALTHQLHWYRIRCHRCRTKVSSTAAKGRKSTSISQKDTKINTLHILVVLETPGLNMFENNNLKSQSKINSNEKMGGFLQFIMAKYKKVGASLLFAGLAAALGSLGVRRSGLMIQALVQAAVNWPFAAVHSQQPGLLPMDPRKIYIDGVKQSLWSQLQGSHQGK